MIFWGLVYSAAGAALFLLLPRRSPVMASREWNRQTAGAGFKDSTRTALQSGDVETIRAASSTSRDLGEARIRTIAIAAPGGGLALWGIATFMGFPAGLMAGLGVLGGAAAGFAIPMANLRQAATAKRRQLADGTAVFLDLASVMMKGGMAMETALQEAAQIGEGGAFAEFRSTIATANQNRLKVLEALADLGDWYQVAELSDLRRTSKAASTAGTGVTEALTRAAASLRADRLRRLRAKAERNLAAMQLPSTVLMFVMMGYLMYGILGSGLGV